MRVYISGPISGHPNGNRPAFEAAAIALRAAGHEPVNPFDIFTEPPPADPSEASAFWLRAMRADVKALVDCDQVAVLDGWGHSKGAKVEVHLALGLGLPVLPLELFLARQEAAA